MTNASCFSQAQKYISGGVNSPVRAFNGVGGTPVFVDHAAGPYLYDTEGKRYIDYVGSWGPMILGHAHSDIVNTVRDACSKGLSFGAPTGIETEMAKMLCELVPSMELVRMVSSGTEATMSAIRLARGYTGRDKIIKFEGCYHGHSDSLLVKAGSGALTLGIPSSPGIPRALAEHTITLPYNDTNTAVLAFDQFGSDIAGVIVEPVAGNMNCIPPVPGFLQALRDLCSQFGAVLIFDEVMTGFRVGLGGAQEIYDIAPDMTTLGKVIGGGMPVGAFGGKREIMESIAPLGPVYQAGTLSGNPIAMAAGLKTLELIAAPGFFETLTKTKEYLIQGIQQAADNAGVALTTNSVGGMFGLFFTDMEKVTNLHQVMQCDQEKFKLFFHEMLNKGVYLAPSAFEAGFVSSAHTSDVLDSTIVSAEQSFRVL